MGFAVQGCSPGSGHVFFDLLSHLGVKFPQDPKTKASRKPPLLQSAAVEALATCNSYLPDRLRGESCAVLVIPVMIPWSILLCGQETCPLNIFQVNPLAYMILHAYFLATWTWSPSSSPTLQIPHLATLSVLPSLCIPLLLRELTATATKVFASAMLWVVPKRSHQQCCDCKHGVVISSGAQRPSMGI